MQLKEISKIKLELIEWIIQLSDESVIELLDGLKKSKSQSDLFDGLTESQNNMLQEGLKDIANGRVISSSQFWNQLKNS